MSTPTIVVLNRQRGAIKASLTNFEKFLESIKVEFDSKNEIGGELLTRLEQRVNLIQTLPDNFETIQNSIECTCEEDDLVDEYEDREVFTERYINAISRANLILKNSSKPLAEVENNTNKYTESIKLVENINLPAINLPKFTGRLNNWLEFKDLYESLIHNNASINEIQKFHYLRSSLEEDALKVIQSLEFSSRNYAIAWDSLCNRYNNKRVLIRNHIKAIFDIEPLTKESSAGLRNIIDCVFKNLRALEQLNRDVSQWDDLLVYIMTTKLDKNSDRDWDKYSRRNEFPTLVEIQEFLKDKADYLETVEAKGKPNDTLKSGKKVALVASSIQCNYCKNDHLIYKCNEFLNLSIEDRISKVKSKNLCLNCLCINHTKKCKYMSCKICKGKHNILLHLKKVSAEQGAQVCHVKRPNAHVLLSTAVVHVPTSIGQLKKCRVLLDSGSQINFISTRMCRMLNLKQEKADVSINLLNKMQSKSVNCCTIKIRSTTTEFCLSCVCYIIPNITDDLPAYNFNIESWNIPKNINLADSNFNMSSPIDMLLCSGIYHEILNNDKINLGKGLPKLIDTKLGWIVGGYMSNIKACNYVCNLSRISQQSKLECTIRKFWEVEDGFLSNMSIIDEECEEHFRENFSRDPDGRFIVRIPLKRPISQLGNSKEMALKRFLQLECKLNSNSTLREQYSKFLAEYWNLNHMTMIEPEKSIINYYLPHHGVSRQDSLTTQLRVVFDGSAITKSGVSLNDLQYIGPAIQNDIFDILLRFRQYPYVVCADITKMYRQILVHPDDRSLQNILWRFNPNEPISVFQLNTVTYGTSSAPYLAIRCLRQLANDHLEQFPKASMIISRDFYVDDLITGFDSVNEAIDSCQQIKSILKSGCFPLRKWISNSSQVLDSVKDINEPLSTLAFGENTHTKLLGIKWLSKSDCLSYNILESPPQRHISKRCILSDISKIYDPLGLLSPIIIIAKIMIQELWLLKIGWDEKIPLDLSEKWTKFRDSLPVINNFNIHRHAMCKEVKTLELHGFCDASNKAYGACIYVKSIDNNGKVQISLLCSKTKVAPLKTLTTPRLELCSALLLSKLMKRVTQALNIIVEPNFWSDSQIILCWIQTQPKMLHTFVSNRVSQIQAITDPVKWNYINTKENPADLASRGILPQALMKSQLWWNGPEWLSFPVINMKKCSFGSVIIPEFKNQANVIVEEKINFFIKYSSLIKLQRVVGYLMRFISNARTPRATRTGGPLTVQELERSMMKLVAIAQLNAFPEEITALKNKKSLKIKHKILQLSPFLDEKGLLRVGGRLRNSDLNVSTKHPLLISGNHPLTNLLFQHYHIKLLHAGPQLLLNHIRETYWPTAGMHAAKRVVRGCIRCFRCKPQPLNALMGDLPKDRVTVQHPFSVSGVDYAGPFLLKERKGRGSKLFKAYICLFVCFATKAVHLELVSDLTSESFIATLRRFAARRGKPRHLYSDNGTQFVGAKREISALYNFLNKELNVISTLCAQENITWSFIPPNSPHFGGLWEAGVKSVKFHLKRAIGEAHLTYEEFYTLLVQIESILNSRPLHALSCDISNLDPLTPAHFLIGKSLISIPDPNLLELPLNKLSRFQLIQQIQQSFWYRWSREYLSHLQVRNKWKQATVPIQIGALVLIKEDHTPPLRWLLARVTHLHPGKDGQTRVVTLQTEKGTQKRSITKICPLPIPEVTQSPLDM